MKAQQARQQAPFVDIPAGDFKRKFNGDRPQFAVNHDESIRNIIPLHSNNLEADGCAFTCALDWLMTLAGFNETPRSFVRAVAGAIERDADGKGKCMEITDKRLAELMNCSPKTVQRQRKEYLKQEQSINFSIIRVEEGEFDHKRDKHATTIYEFLIGKQAAQTVERARTSPLWKRDQFAAMREAAREVFNDIDEAPLASTKRKKRVLSPESEARKLRQTIVALAKRLGDQTRKIKDADTIASLRLDELQNDIEEAMISGDLRQVFATKEVDPPTGHFVQPLSTPQPVHNAEVRMRTTPDDVATGDVWTRIENRLRPEHPVGDPITEALSDVSDAIDFVEITSFIDEPPVESTYKLEVDELLTADELAERAAIQDEANGKLSSTPTPSFTATTAAITPPQPTTSTTTIASTPPLEDENAAYKRYNKLIDDRAAELSFKRGLDDLEAQRQAWSEVGIFPDWFERNRAPVSIAPPS